MQLNQPIPQIDELLQFVRTAQLNAGTGLSDLPLALARTRVWPCRLSRLRMAAAGGDVQIRRTRREPARHDTAAAERGSAVQAYDQCQDENRTGHSVIRRKTIRRKSRRAPLGCKVEASMPPLPSAIVTEPSQQEFAGTRVWHKCRIGKNGGMSRPCQEFQAVGPARTDE